MADRAPFGIQSEAEVAEQGPSLLDKLVAGIIHGTVSIPKNVIDATMATAPGLRREDFTDIPGTAQPGADMRAATMDAAINMATGVSPFSIKGAAGVFGGRLAATADKAALKQAETMAASGADRKEIWDKTGWFKGSDDKWRFEIPDYNSQMNQTWHDLGVPNYQASKIAGQVWHDDLYKAYPDLRQATGVFEKSQQSSGGSYISPLTETGAGAERINVQAPNAPAARSVALHEIQHAIQEREGFARGANPSMFTQADDANLSRAALSWRREMDRFPGTMAQKDKAAEKSYRDLDAVDWMPGKEARSVAMDMEGNPSTNLEKLVQLYGLDKRTTPYDPKDLYRSAPGEIEARNVQTRMDMTPAELKAKPPWETLHWMDTAASSPVLDSIFTGRVGMLEQRAPAMSMPENLSLEELFAQSKRRIAAAEDLTKEAASVGKMVFEKDGKKVAISPSLNPEYKHRVTNFDDKGPVGHREYKANDMWGLESEIRMLLGAGYKVKR